MDIRKIQIIEYEMLRDFAAILDKYHIRYWLAYGTCLGAARHAGFIPWDDDVDLYICGEDYPKIREIFQNEDTGRLKLHDYSTEDDYPFVFPKIVNTNTKLKERRYKNLKYECGVFIDVFPLFEVSDCKIIRKCQYLKRKIYRAIIEAHYRGVKGKLICRVLKLFNVNTIHNKLYQIYVAPHKGKKYLCEPLQYGDNTSWAKLHKKENFAGSDMLHFEDSYFSVPKGYEQYLSDQYGDWRNPPPPDERETSHSFVYFEINE